MNILHVNTWDIHGGASRAAYRIHHALLGQGVNSQMLVQTKLSDDHTVDGPRSKISKGLSMIRPDSEPLLLLGYRRRKNAIFSSAILPFSGTLSRINRTNADLVHLHWIAGGMMRIEDLARINKPVVWSLHDMWAFTGGCHYDEGCGRYKDSCGACPTLGSQARDLSTRIFNRKRRVFRRKAVHVVALSRWLAGCVKESALLREMPITCLPNPIDTNTFRPLDKQLARNMLGLPSDAKLILFGAVKATSDPRKGLAKLSEALPNISTEHVELAIFGASRPCDETHSKYPTHYLGRLVDDLSLRVAYSAADVVVVPSLQENLSNVVMESLACGTPVVGFDIGGNPDMIDHQRNGYLARPHDSADLARGIDWVLNHPDPEALARNAREKVVREFDSQVVAKRYVDLYQQVLDG